MPVEIRELVIKASVVDNKSSTDDMAVNSVKLELLKKELVQICVREIMQKLEDKQER